MSNPVRTTPGAVQAVLGPEYDTLRTPDLAPFIRAASFLVDLIPAFGPNMVFVPAAFVANALANLADIEAWLAAHLYQQQDPGYNSRSTAGASGQFNAPGKIGLKGTRFGITVLAMDTSRVLNAIDEGKFAGVSWAGKPLAAQLTYNERNGTPVWGM